MLKNEQKIKNGYCSTCGAKLEFEDITGFFVFCPKCRNIRILEEEEYAAYVKYMGYDEEEARYLVEQVFPVYRALYNEFEQEIDEETIYLEVNNWDDAIYLTLTSEQQIEQFDEYDERVYECLREVSCFIQWNEYESQFEIYP